MKRLVVDLDGTLTVDADGEPYATKQPNRAMIERLREYRADGFAIVIATARNMRTYSGSIGHINAFTLPGVIAWLDQNEVPYDEIHVGKPWCGTDGFYIDDKAIRPSEFCALSYSEIQVLLRNETADEADAQ
jgi:capsule biosynthesis phosphatase